MLRKVMCIIGQDTHAEIEASWRKEDGCSKIAYSSHHLTLAPVWNIFTIHMSQFQLKQK